MIDNCISSMPFGSLLCVDGILVVVDFSVKCIKVMILIWRIDIADCLIDFWDSGGKT